jgi:proteasome accessory factor C
MSEPTGGRVERRLRRILLLLPYAIRNPGISLDELSERFGVPKSDVVDDLQLLFVCGVPGYGPGDLIEVAIDDDYVYVDMADYFASPLRLTPAEALALYAGAEALAALPQMEEADALRRGAAKLGRALGLDAGNGAGIEMRLLPGPASHHARLSDALGEHKRARLEYLSASRGELTTREVDPWALIVAWGRSYLVAWDHLSGEERMFRTDRIKSVEVLPADAPVPPDFDPQAYSRAFVERPEQQAITLELSPAVARWFLDYYPVRRSRILDDSWHEVELATNSDHWAATVVLRLGAEVRAVPDAVARRARELATAIAAAHEA